MHEQFFLIILSLFVFFKKILKDGGFAGTSIYASLNVHDGYSESRRDDMESLGYVMMEMLTGPLPWHSVQVHVSSLVI